MNETRESQSVTVVRGRGKIIVQRLFKVSDSTGMGDVQTPPMLQPDKAAVASNVTKNYV